MTSLTKGFGVPKKKKVDLKNEKGLPIGVAMVKDASGRPMLAFDPGFAVGKVRPLVKKKQYESMFQHSSNNIGWDYFTEDIKKWGSTTGRWTPQPLDWQQALARLNNGLYDRRYLDVPRYSGKEASKRFLESWESFKGLGAATEKAKTGLEQLREANDVWMEKLHAAENAARVAITDEKVYAFMEQNYLPEHYARKLLEEAYKDSILNEGNVYGQEE